MDSSLMASLIIAVLASFYGIHGAPCGSDQLGSADPSPPYKVNDFDLELTNKSSLRKPRHAPFENFRGKRFRSSEKLEWSSQEAWEDLGDILMIPAVSAREWRMDSRPRLRPPPGRALSESLEHNHSSALRWVSSELLSHRTLSSSSSMSSSEQIDEIGQELRFGRVPRDARYRSATDIGSLERVGNYSN